MKLDINDVREFAGKHANLSRAIGVYWEVLAIVASETGNSPEDLHEAFEPWRSKPLFEMNKKEIRDLVGCIWLHLMSLDIDITNILGHLEFKAFKVEGIGKFKVTKLETRNKDEEVI